MEKVICPLCKRAVAPERSCRPIVASEEAVYLLGKNNPWWAAALGSCQRCVRQYERLVIELKEYSTHLSERKHWIIPTPLRLEVDHDYTGRGVTMAFLDSGFYLHPDLIEPKDRVVEYVNILKEKATAEDRRREVAEPNVDAWHGMMTSVVAAGNGRLSKGAYRGIACEAQLVLVKVGSISRIVHDDIRKGIQWVIQNKDRYGIRILNISCGGDYEESYLTDPLCRAAEDAVRAGLVVVVAVGNQGHEPGHPVIAPANAPAVISVGGLNDQNQRDWSGFRMYNSSFGPTIDGLQKPEIIAPSIWLAAPILPGTPVAAQAGLLELLDKAPDRRLKPVLRQRQGVEPTLDVLIDRPAEEIRVRVNQLVRENNVISAHYKHVDGTSFAAPIVSSVVAQMLQANPSLTPQQVKRALIASCRRVSRCRIDQQGWGLINPRRAVELVKSISK
jgi:serine protease AprX